MKILHTIPGLRLTAGGPPLSVSLTVIGLRDLGIDTEILAYDVVSAAQKNIVEGPFIHLLPSPKERRFVYSPHFKDWLTKHQNYDLYHVQGVWQYPSFATASFAREMDKPYVITPRGMLYPQIFKNNPLMKSLLWNLGLKKDVQKAACVHVTCVEEMEHLRNRGITSPMAVIPNPVDVAQLAAKEIVIKDGVFRVGYLGRVDPRKNIDRLITAWAALGEKVKDGELLIIGAGDVAHHEALKAQAKRLRLTNVKFTGFLSGQEKEDAINSLSYLAVPSDFENFGMIVAEALMHGVPVMASKGTPWQELASHECGWWIANDAETIKNTLLTALALPEEQRQQMGRNGKALILQQYAKDVIAAKMKRLYEWLLQKTNQPDFVYLDK